MSDNSPFTFAVYHTELSDEGIDHIAKLYPYHPKVKWAARWKEFKDNYLPFASEYIDTFFRSVRLIYPDSTCIVLSDQSTTFTLSNTIEIRRYDLDPDKPAYMRLIAQRELIKEKDLGHTVFMDYDMLLQKPLDPLFKREFDLALTHEPATNRIQGSFILVRHGHKEKGVHYYDIVEKTFLERFTEYTPWGGIEGAMNGLLEKKLLTMGRSGILDLEGIHIRILPCERYNYPLNEKEYLTLPEHLLGKRLLHFRGKRKSKMLEYWKTYYRHT